MSLAAVRRHAIPQLYEKLTALLSELQDKTRYFQRKRKREQVFWSNSSRQDDNKSTKKEIHQLWSRSESVGRTSIVQGLPECLSRLEYAAQALFAEMVRGFFLPFCTVAVAAISRVRTLLLRLGKFALLEYLPQLQSEWKALLLAVAPTRHETSAMAEVMRPNQLWGQESSKSSKEHHDASYDAFIRARTAVTTAVHEASVDFASRTKAERTQSMLESLGLSSMHGLDASLQAKSNIAQETENTTTDAASTAAEEVMSKMILPESPEVDDTAKGAADIGEAVRPREEDDETPVAESEEKNFGFEGAISADGVDRNSEIVQNLKAQNKKKKKKRKGVTADSDGRSKKNKKRSKKGDFFDELFAT